MNDTVMFTIVIGASVIVALAAIWLIAYFAYKPMLKRSADKKRIFSVVREQVQCWKKVGYIECDPPLLACQDFFIANNHMSMFDKEDDYVKAFMLINSLKYGKPGNWGKWLLLNKKNQEVVLPLVNMLDGQTGKRAMWRAAFILSKIFADKSEQVAGFIPANIDYTRLQLQLIKKDEVSKLLTFTSLNDEPEYIMQPKGRLRNEENDVRDFRFITTTEKKKAVMVLNEFNHFKNQVELFAKEQTISHRVKMPSFTPASIVASIF